ncbi:MULTISPECIES: PhzF family phenazine biosynthesis protein [Streptomyces]|uniref:PhzF family phenazine biosynthesis protein n=1 Tax=Streptomyces TaxID=1883 RepID=UPI00163D3CDA|nr:MULTISPECIES: PhzF family phenazine biosynthesis protein [Streptomyces]MBC2873914.1 PhzF family phenazine biosynthesis protein [Streptomyces sp. TYQ1024]UBI39142.1 PhzF family phenazine biosynthesis protein [Streptomyces mobaraensis]UKW31722.1 PhzF family phenazine biosynthesis protein [Streptomyces sp. TYQ1024]
MIHVHILSVFRGPGGKGGNPLGVVLDGASVPGPERRQALAAELGFSETVFVDDAERGAVDIWTPSVRLPFAGHPLIGVASLLTEADVLRPPAGEVPVRRDGDVIRIAGRAEWASGRRMERYGSVAEVDALPAPPPGEGWLYAWAWEDEAAGRVRARAFPRRGDAIAEDEATGAAALVLTAELGRALEIRQGVGSRIVTRPLPDGTIEVGGRAVAVEERVV